MIEQFNINNIRLLQSMGATVCVGTNFSQPGTITNQVCKRLQKKLDRMGVKYYQVDFMRGVGNHRANQRALNQVCQIVKDNKINGIHAHSPLGGDYWSSGGTPDAREGIVHYPRPAIF